MQLQLVRHATLILTYGGKRILVDPMLGDPGAMAAVPVSANRRRNPLVSLPASPAEVVSGVDSCLVTHLHFDHWDATAAEALPKLLPLFCQPGDERRLKAKGFKQVRPVHQPAEFDGIALTRTDGRHGRGLIGRAMGKVSGFVLQAPGEPTLYIAGDTVWCRDVDEALHRHRPEVTVVNAGGACFAAGDPITMNAADIAQVCREAPGTKVVAVHMDAINHCHVTREALRATLAGLGLQHRVAIPEDGETITFE